MASLKSCRLFTLKHLLVLTIIQNFPIIMLVRTFSFLLVGLSLHSSARTHPRQKRQAGFSFSLSSYTFCPTSPPVIGQVSIVGSPTGSVTYSLSNLPPSTPITMNSQNGQLSYTTNNPQGQISVTVQAVDMAGASRTAQIVVQSPAACATTPSSGITFAQPSYVFPVDNCAIGTVVGQVVASYSGGQLIYQPAVVPIPNINLNPYTGQMYVVGTIHGTQTFQVLAYTLSSSAPPASVTVTLTGSCVGPSSATTTATSTTTTTQQPWSPQPVFTQPFYQFQPTSCAPGTRIGQVTTNPYSIIIAEPATPSLTVDATTGNIIANTGASSGTTTIPVRAWTAGPSTSATQSTAVIQIACPTTTPSADPPVIFGRENFLMQIYNCGVGRVVGSVYVLNPTASLRFAMAGAATGFSIDPLSGVISVRSPVGSNKTYRFSVSATNNGNAPKTARVTITTVTDCPNAYPLGNNVPAVLDY